MKKIAHIIVAAGSGLRYGAPLPKQFCDLAGRPLLMTTVDNIARACGDAEMVLVLNADYVSLWEAMCREHHFVSPRIVAGGDTRWASVKNALCTLDDDVAIVTVHDGARPMVTPDLTRRVIKAVEEGHEGAIPMVAVTDSMRRVDPDREGVTHSIDRSTLRAVQTPQGFNAPLLRDAYRRPFSPSFTDDASVMEAAGYIDLVEVAGDARNIKVTRPGDIAVAELFLSDM